jgi:hypothetical protein
MTSRLRHVPSTLVVTAIAVAYIIAQGVGSRPTPRLERPAQTERPRALPSPPSARQILDRRADLALSGGQVVRLEELDREWQKASAALGTTIEAARTDFSRFIEERTARSASVQEIQRQSEEFRELSAELRQRRLDHAHAAVALLTETQRHKLAVLRRDATSGEMQ